MTKLIVDKSNVFGLGAVKVSELIIDALYESNIDLEIVSSQKRKSKFYNKISLLFNRFLKSFLYINQLVFTLGDYPIPFKRKQVVFVQQALLNETYTKLFLNKNYGQIFNNLYFKVFSNNKSHFIFQSNFLRNECVRKYMLNPENSIVIRFPIPAGNKKQIQNGVINKYFFCVTSDYWYKGNYELINFWEKVVGPTYNINLKITLYNTCNKMYKYIDFVGKVEQIEIVNYIQYSIGIISNSKIESLYLPAFEASENRKCVITRPIPSLVEYFDESLYYFSDVQDLVTIINEIMNEPIREPRISIDIDDEKKLCNIIKKLI